MNRHSARRAVFFFFFDVESRHRRISKDDNNHRAQPRARTQSKRRSVEELSASRACGVMPGGQEAFAPVARAAALALPAVAEVSKGAKGAEVWAGMGAGVGGGAEVEDDTRSPAPVEKVSGDDDTLSPSDVEWADLPNDVVRAICLAAAESADFDAAAVAAVGLLLLLLLFLLLLLLLLLFLLLLLHLLHLLYARQILLSLATSQDAVQLNKQGLNMRWMT